MTDLFKATHCDRCNSELTGGRKMSWFTEATICMECVTKEAAIKQQLPEGGRHHEACGYVPILKCE